VYVTVKQSIACWFLWESKIGTNYSWNPDSGFRLKCCTEDAYSMANFLCGTALVSSIDAKNSLIVPLANFDFARRDVRVMADEVDNRRNLPTKENIVRRP